MDNFLQFQNFFYYAQKLCLASVQKLFSFFWCVIFYWVSNWRLFRIQTNYAEVTVCRWVRNWICNKSRMERVPPADWVWGGGWAATAPGDQRIASLISFSISHPDENHVTTTFQHPQFLPGLWFCLDFWIEIVELFSCVHSSGLKLVWKNWIARWILWSNFLNF